jgi:hypothetical protein
MIAMLFGYTGDGRSTEAAKLAAKELLHRDVLWVTRHESDSVVARRFAQDIRSRLYLISPEEYERNLKTPAGLESGLKSFVCDRKRPLIVIDELMDIVCSFHGGDADVWRAGMGICQRISDFGADILITRVLLSHKFRVPSQVDRYAVIQPKNPRRDRRTRRIK